jgi:hypothetical protein
MIRRLNPKYFITIGLVLLVTGVVLPILMVMQILESTFFLNFFSYIASVLGLMLGVIGIAYKGAEWRRNRKQ